MGAKTVRAATLGFHKCGHTVVCMSCYSFAQLYLHAVIRKSWKALLALLSVMNSTPWDQKFFKAVLCSLSCLWWYVSWNKLIMLILQVLVFFSAWNDWFIISSTMPMCVWEFGFCWPCRRHLVSNRIQYFTLALHRVSSSSGISASG